MPYVDLLTGARSAQRDRAREAVALLDVIDDVLCPEALPARMLPGAVRRAIEQRRAAFDALADGELDAWAARDRAISARLDRLLGTDWAPGSPSSDEQAANSGEMQRDAVRAVEDAAEMEREAWCRWLFVAGALLGAQGADVDVWDVREVLALAADALDEEDATRSAA